MTDLYRSNSKPAYYYPVQPKSGIRHKDMEAYINGNPEAVAKVEAWCSAHYLL